jgi:hypothetical protein
MQIQLGDFIRRFDATILDIEHDQGKLLLEAAMDAKATVIKRIIETGINHEGGRFGSPNNPGGYSRKPMLVNGSSFWKKSGNESIAGSKEKRKELKWVTIKKGGRTIKLYELEGGYEQFRQLQGRQTAHVDFSYTGRMWANTDIISKSENKVVIGAQSEENRKKMEGLTERFGTILALNDVEIDTLRDNYIHSVKAIFDKRL